MANLPVLKSLVTLATTKGSRKISSAYRNNVTMMKARQCLLSTSEHSRPKVARDDLGSDEAVLLDTLERGVVVHVFKLRLRVIQLIRITLMGKKIR